MLKINQKIDSLLLDGILNPENYSKTYPYPLNIMLRDELDALGENISEANKITYTSTDSSTKWFFGDICLVEIVFGIKPKYIKPYRESMYSWVIIENPEPIGWETYRDADIYAHRMATICDYLENLFSFEMNEKDKTLSDRLMACHYRQKRQIENVMGSIQKVDDRKSFYYERMFGNFNNDIQFLWAILTVSYLRAKTRFEKLLTHNSLQNSKYLFNTYSEDGIEFNSNMWLQFYKDAEETSALVLDYLYMNYPEKEITEKLHQVLDAEKILINEINEYNK